MKERPILFKGEMVRAILEGRKTVTRRALKMPHGYWETSPSGELVPVPINCPYGNPGDRLWVRETFAQVGHVDPGYLTYRATYPRCLLAAHPDLENVPDDIRTVGERWRPSIHMPRSLSRILLEVTDVRVERLQAITDEQCVVEGIGLNDSAIGVKMTVPQGESLPRFMFQELWKSINGADSWDANPWVWVVEFKRIEP